MYTYSIGMINNTCHAELYRLTTLVRYQRSVGQSALLRPRYGRHRIQQQVRLFEA